MTSNLLITSEVDKIEFRECKQKYSYKHQIHYKNLA